MSNHEHIAQVAHDKRVTVSDSLGRSLMIKEQIVRFFSESLVHSFTHSQKKLNKTVFLCTFVKSLLCKFFIKTSDLLITSFVKSDVSKSLRLLTKNERMSKKLFFLSESLIRLFCYKTSNLLRKPMS